METPYTTKITQLATQLLRHPRDIVPYLQHLPLWKKGPIDYALPWISFGALHYLDTHLRPQHEVFELGGGGSTLWFASRAKSVLTMESDPSWHAALTFELRRRQLTNVVCEYHRISGRTPAEFASDEFFQRMATQLWDIILVDCYCGYGEARYGLMRPHALELALHHTKPGGVIVLDDSWMYREFLGARPGWEIRDFIGPGPCRYGVTSTAIFHRIAT